MAYVTKIRTRSIGDHTRILVLVKNSSSSGRDSRTGPFIERITFTMNGRAIAEAELGPATDDNPLTGISVAGAQSGDRVAVAWTDSEGESGGAESTIG